MKLLIFVQNKSQNAEYWVVACEDTNHGKSDELFIRVVCEDTNHGKSEDTNHGKVMSYS
jgi:hypothetical protein